MNTKEDIKNILKLNKASILMALSLALLAAMLTAFFALTRGVLNPWTIFNRSMFSFFLFAIAGFLTARFLLREYAKNTMPTDESITPENVVDVSTETFAADDSFDKIVVVNDQEEQK